MADLDPDVMLSALNAFADQQYGQCLVTIATMNPVHDRLLVQLYIICLQRLGFTDEIQALTDRVLPQLGRDPQMDVLVHLALGLAEPDAVTGSVDDAKLEFCLGSRLLSLGDVDAARDHLSRCAEHPEESLERMLARIQLEWPSQEPPFEGYSREVDRANARSVELIRVGSPDALEAAAEAYWLARRVMPFGELRLYTALNYAHALLDAGQPSEAEDHCREVFFLHRHCSSDVDSELVTTLVLMGRVFLAQERYAEASDVLQDALQREQAISGEASAGCAVILEHLVTATEASGDQERTIIARLRYFDVAVDVDGPSAVHSTAKILVESLRAAGRDPDAERICSTWLDRSNAADPAWLPGVIAALSRLADIYDDHERYDEAGSCYDRLVGVLESAGSADEVAARKSFMFSRLRADDLAQADEVSERMLDLARESGIAGSALAEALACRALCLQKLGRHAESIGLLTEALPLAGMEGAVSVHGLLADAFQELKDPVAGLANQRALVDLLRNDDADGQESNVELMVQALNRFAVILLELRKLHEANDVLTEADRIVEAHPNLPPGLAVAILNARGVAAMQADDYASAVESLTAADEVMTRVDTGVDPLPILANILRSRHILGPEAADAELVDRIAKLAEAAEGLSRADALLLLGEDAIRRGDTPGAISLLRASLTANVGSSREHRQARASCHFSLATALAATRDFAAAFEAVEMGEQFRKVTLLEAGSTASEQERLRILARSRHDMGLLFTLATHRRADPVATRAAWQALLRSKAFAYEAMAIHRSPGGGGVSDELAAARNELAAFDLRGFPVIGDSEDAFAVFDKYHEARNVLRRRIARLEEALGVAPDRRARLELVLGTHADEVIAALPARTALIEFVRYDMAVFDVAELHNRAGPVPVYGAFLITADGPAGFFPLGDALEVENALSHSGRTSGVLADVLAAIPPDIDRLIFVPDGGFAKVSMASLSAPGGGMLIDGFVIAYLDTARNVLEVGTVQEAPISAVVISNPAFDLTDGVPSESGQAPVPWDFVPLPGTLLEGRAVERMLGAVHWTGSDATKARILQLHAPIVLHLATHGFFLDDDLGTVWEVDLGLTFGLAPEHLTTGRLTGARLSNPFLRSGLALAGANDWLRTGHTREPWGDGLLTAHDVTGLDLRGTQLVVFSACEAGLGAIRSGDGVLGLRRAMRLAGVRAQIMTLARIPDLASAVLVIRLYEILRDNETCGDVALRQAQLYVRDVTVQELQSRFFSSAFVDLIPASVHAWLAAADPTLQPFHDERNWASFVYVGPPARLKMNVQAVMA